MEGIHKYFLIISKEPKDQLSPRLSTQDLRKNIAQVEIDICILIAISWKFTIR